MTQDNAWDVSPSWTELKQLLENMTANRDAWEMTAAELEAERDEAFQRGKQVHDDLLRVEKERDISQANLSAIRIAFDVLKASETDEDADIAVTNIERLVESDTYAARITELKAQWQAEILEEIAGEHFSFSDAQLEAKAADLRRQAEGSQ